MEGTVYGIVQFCHISDMFKTTVSGTNLNNRNNDSLKREFRMACPKKREMSGGRVTHVECFFPCNLIRGYGIIQFSFHILRALCSHIFQRISIRETTSVFRVFSHVLFPLGQGCPFHNVTQRKVVFVCP